MKSTYYHVKKSRHLNKVQNNESGESIKNVKSNSLIEKELVTQNSLNESISDETVIVGQLTDQTCELQRTEYPEDDVYEDDVSMTSCISNGTGDLEANNIIEVLPQTLSEKIKFWALSNITTLTNKCISELLVILRSEGHVSLPRRADTLLGTVHDRPTQAMLTKRGSEGRYIYVGIEQALKKIINENIYKENRIRILVNIDGIPLFRNSRKQFWPILIQIFDLRYRCNPVIVGIFFGDSKPASPGEFLHDFIQESIILTTNGIMIRSKRYDFEILAFVCDTPARSFIKCCKGHNGFYGCERCETKGLTAGKNKRVYPEMNSDCRTHESFQKQSQPGHHHQHETSPLLLIPNFDIIQGVTLDYMHLLCIGVMRTLFEKWLSTGKSLARIKRSKRKILRESFKMISPSIPCEFQRKEYDLEDWEHWKATQFRFVILHCGAIVLQDVLSTKYYKHFLLLFVASRILCSSENAVKYRSYARDLLRKFFYLMPTLYNCESQTMNFHNLIHVADDVRFMNAPLSSFSAFPFENALGKIKKLIRAPKNPLAQVVNRLAELDAMPDNIVQPRSVISQILFATDKSKTPFCIRKININDETISSSRPDNLVLLHDGNIIRIKTLYVTKHECTKLNEVGIEGSLVKIKGNIFEYPQASSMFGMFELGKCVKKNIKCSGADIKNKCTYLKVCNKKYAVSLLH